MKHLFIINPASGKGTAVKYEEIIKDYFTETEDEAFIEITTRPGEAKEIVERYVKNDIYRVYAIGGDGTLNEVLNGIIGSNSSIGIIPAGSGNDFVRSFLTKRQYENILYKTINGDEIEVDVGKVNDKFFINVSSIGFDANVVNNAIKLKGNKILTGSMAYLLSIILTIVKFKSIEAVIEVDDLIYNEEIFLVTIANGKYYGGGLVIAPNASINDGNLDIYIIRKTSIHKLIKYLFAILLGKDISQYKETRYIKGGNIKIYSKKELILNIDGELKINKIIEFSIIPNGIKLIAPGV